MQPKGKKNDAFHIDEDLYLDSFTHFIVGRVAGNCLITPFSYLYLNDIR